MLLCSPRLVRLSELVVPNGHRDRHKAENDRPARSSAGWQLPRYLDLTNERETEDENPPMCCRRLFISALETAWEPSANRGTILFYTPHFDDTLLHTTDAPRSNRSTFVLSDMQIGTLRCLAGVVTPKATAGFILRKPGSNHSLTRRHKPQFPGVRVAKGS